MNWRAQGHEYRIRSLIGQLLPPPVLHYFISFIVVALMLCLKATTKMERDKWEWYSVPLQRKDEGIS